MHLSLSNVGVFFIHFLLEVFALLLMFTLLSSTGSQSLNCTLNHKHHFHNHYQTRLQNHVVSWIDLSLYTLLGVNQGCHEQKFDGTKNQKIPVLSNIYPCPVSQTHTPIQGPCWVGVWWTLGWHKAQRWRRLTGWGVMWPGALSCVCLCMRESFVGCLGWLNRLLCHGMLSWELVEG